MNPGTVIKPDPERIGADWERLSQFRHERSRGWTRRVFSSSYLEARSWLEGRMSEAGLATNIDAGGNLVGRRDGTMTDLPPIVLGSHTDTVEGGGRFDGIVGVLGAIEVVRCLEEGDLPLEHPLEVIDFLGEEPNDFGMSMVGSRVIAGALDDLALARRDPRGRRLADAIASVGGRPDEIDAAARRRGSVALYLELHIEQGPVLERERCQVGIVTAITGVTRFRIEVEGRSDHAGGTPMSERRDALAASSEIVLLMERLWGDGRGVGTIGRVLLRPNAINVVPGFAELWTDMRTMDEEVLDSNRKRFPEQLEEIANRRGVDIRVDPLSHERPVPIGEEVQAVIESVARDLGIRGRRLPSYAGHDANQMAKIGPIGMVFVPSHDGRSHCPEEWTEIADILTGVEVLGEALLRLDRKFAAS